MTGVGIELSQTLVWTAKKRPSDVLKIPKQYYEHHNETRARKAMQILIQKFLLAKNMSKRYGGNGHLLGIYNEHVHKQTCPVQDSLNNSRAVTRAHITTYRHTSVHQYQTAYGTTVSHGVWHPIAKRAPTLTSRILRLACYCVIKSLASYMTNMDP